MAALPVVLAGARGHGRQHLRNIRRLAAEGLVELAGICELTPLTPQELSPQEPAAQAGPAPEQSADLGSLLDRTGARIAVLCTPIHTHADLALTAADHGAHVLLEKPPMPSYAAFRQLTESLAASGISCQIGFQSLGSHAPAAIRGLVAEGAIGVVRGIGAAGSWVRDEAYWNRAPWAGQRRLDGHDVVDGVLTNPLAHAVATALRIDGSDRAEDIAEIELELYRAHDIASDDTSCARIRTAAGGEIVAALTLCAEQNADPYVTVHGDAGRITLWYKQDRVLLERDGHEPETRQYPRTDLLRNLVAHLRDGEPLLVPPERTGAFMRVVEAVRTAPDPVRLPGSAWRSAPGPRRVVTGIDALVADGARTLSLFSELNAPWARPASEVTRP